MNMVERRVPIAFAAVALALVVLASGVVKMDGSSRATQDTQGGLLAPSGSVPGGGASGPAGAGVVSPPTQNGIVTGSAYRHDVSQPLRDIKIVPFDPGANRRSEEHENPSIPLVGHKDQPDLVVQRTFGLLGRLAMPTPIGSFDGLNRTNGSCNCAPPDTNGEVGPNHYVQTVNSGFQIFNKAGTSLFGPAAINTIWSGFGGACQTRNDGDPVVLYDQLADRWLVSQFTSASPYNECIAISSTADPTGSWNRYAFQLSTADFPDYPHLGVWPDGYYMSVNWFTGGTTYAGPRPYVFDRTNMLSGAAATFQTTTGPLGNTVAPVLPSDLDGSTTPPANAPNYFQSFGSTIRLYQFHVDWATPGNTTWTNSASLAAAGFTQLCPGTSNCISQTGTATKLDGIGDRGMFRLAYRNFGGYESLVSNHSVDAGSGVAGVRWYEIRSPGSSPSIYQQGTYSPDATSRWMGSAAMDRNGDLAIGYSASSASIFPEIRYAGRLVGDPLGQLSQGEATLFAGTGAQTSPSRWGDYSDLTVDPTDDCTFWYTTEYYQTTSSFNWRTRIGSFKFPSCVAGTATPTPTGTAPTSTPTFSPTNTPTVTPTPCGASANYGVASSTGATIVAGTTDTTNHCDDCATSITLPFAYTLYDQSFTTALVSSNGQLDFVTSDTAFTNSCLPDGVANFAIFGHWDDLRTDTGTGCSSYTGGCGVFTSVSGSAPNRVLNIEWRTALFTGGAAVNFEIRLYEGQTRFDVVYGTVSGSGGSATVGVQRDTGSKYTQFSCNTATLSAGQQLAFTLPACGTATPTPAATNTSTNTPSATPTRTSTSTDTPVPTNTNTATNTPVPTSTSTNTPVPTNTPTNTATNTPTSTFTSTNTPTRTFTSTNTPVPTNTPTNTLTSTPTSTFTSTNTNTPVPTNTATNTSTNTPVPTSTSTSTNTAVPTSTSTNTPTSTFTSTSTNTATSTSTKTSTNTSTNTPVPTSTVTHTPTITPTPTITNTPTRTVTKTATSTSTITPVPTDTATYTPSNTPLPTNTPTRTITKTSTATSTPVPTNTNTATGTNTPTSTSTPLNRLVGHVNWQARPAQPNNMQQLPLTLTLKSGATEANYPSQDTSGSGVFTQTTGLPAGAYNWRVKGPKYLAISGPVTLAPGAANSVEMGMLRVGDANDDNLINVFDFSIMKPTFGRSQGEPSYDDRADFTGEHLVNVMDFSYLKQNFGSGGAPPLGPWQAEK